MTTIDPIDADDTKMSETMLSNAGADEPTVIGERVTERRVRAWSQDIEDDTLAAVEIDTKASGLRSAHLTWIALAALVAALTIIVVVLTTTLLHSHISGAQSGFVAIGLALEAVIVWAWWTSPKHNDAR